MMNRHSRSKRTIPRRLGRRLVDEHGFSLTEVLTALVLTLVTTGALSSYLLNSALQAQTARQDLSMWNAAQAQMEQLLAQGYSSVSSGSGTVLGFPMTWQVTGSTPKHITLVVQATGPAGIARPDTFVTYMSN